jgi:hypothetical protein
MSPNLNNNQYTNTNVDFETFFRFTPGERGALSHLKVLAEIWGYRAGRNGNHVAFELESHDSKLIFVQNLTDLLFRPLQQGVVYRDDIVPKLRRLSTRAKNIRNSVNQISGISNLLGRYLGRLHDQGRLPLLRILANIDNMHNHTPAFKVMVSAARAILEFDNNNNNNIPVSEKFKRALNIMLWAWNEFQADVRAYRLQGNRLSHANRLQQNFSHLMNVEDIMERLNPNPSPAPKRRRRMR